ncbi:tail tape measure [Alteromonas phage vB_AcoS-R7M]|uniref:Tail tape measure n=1 Tax=Alteromonas phage vB_AcoS-R7M TaxID=2729541 RepID=A0A6M3YP66_9CAUD|nr:tail length tape measure protein [Alteromonas phage vB_AcoS-R7M]QJI53358.1 tail tape measure [Alteromonas phage vB_AcoS-R7M]
MDELASLQIKIDSIEAQLADKRLSALEKTSARTEKATTGLMNVMGRLAAPILAVASASAGLSKLINVTREFEVLNAQLVTATGSAENAATAMQAIQDFASNTPYDLQQVTTAFTKLVNLGLTPSERALTSYGDTASAMGKDLDQLIEAVADAATGEFERLKEFGIRASSEGENVSFTFRGITTTVKKEAGAIEEYLTQLGENNFAGAMAERMQTLDGALSNLGDQWDLVFKNISEQGIGEAATDGIREAISALEDFNAYLASGEFEIRMGAIKQLFRGLGEDADEGLNQVTELFGESASDWLEAINDFARDYTRMWAFLPVNARAYIGSAAEYIRYFVEQAKIIAPQMVDEFVLAYKEIYETALVYGKAAADAINPFSDGSFDLETELAKATASITSQQEELKKSNQERSTALQETRDANIKAIFDERDADIAAFDARIEAAEVARKSYEAAQKARSQAGGDRLEGFGVGADTSDEDSKPSTGTEKEFEKLIKGLQTEEESIAESYRRRRQIILDNTEENARARADLLEKLNEQLREDTLVNDGVTDYDSQLNALNEFYERRKEMILELTELTEEERTELEEELEAERLARLEEMELARQAVILKGTSDILGSAAELTKTFAGEQSGVYKALFAASKAFAVAESIVKITQGIASAAALPFPANLPAMATVAASTMGLVSTIQGTQLNFAGAYDEGGNIPLGSYGIVGEYGPEIVKGPANVTSREDTMKMLQSANEPRANAVQNYYNNFAPTIQADRNGFVRPESIKQVEAAAFRGYQRAHRSVA